MKTPSIEELRELTREEVQAVSRGALPRVQKLRDSHHMVARLMALGLPGTEVAIQSGYSYNGVSMLAQDPAFKELIQHYREMLNEQYLGSVDEYYQALLAARNKSLRLINDKLDEAEPGEIPLNQLHAIHSDAADRTGYPKRKDVVVANVDFADSLDAAIARSREAKLINGTTNPESGAGPPSGGSKPSEPGTETEGSPPKASAPLPQQSPSRSQTIRSLLPPTRQEKFAQRRA